MNNIQWPFEMHSLGLLPATTGFPVPLQVHLAHHHMHQDPHSVPRLPKHLVGQHEQLHQATLQPPQQPSQASPLQLRAFPPPGVTRLWTAHPWTRPQGPITRSKGCPPRVSRVQTTGRLRMLRPQHSCGLAPSGEAASQAAAGGAPTGASFPSKGGLSRFAPIPASQEAPITDTAVNGLHSVHHEAHAQSGLSSHPGRLASAISSQFEFAGVQPDASYASQDAKAKTASETAAGPAAGAAAPQEHAAAAGNKLNGPVAAGKPSRPSQISSPGRQAATAAAAAGPGTATAHVLGARSQADAGQSAPNGAAGLDKAFQEGLHLDPESVPVFNRPSQVWHLQPAQ